MIAIFLLLILICLLIYSKFHRRIPVLMYHRIASVPGERNSLPVEKFKEQLDYLQLHGYTTITMQDLYNHYTLHSPLPTKSVLLTFDDGYEDNFSVALPLLRERNMKAIVFPIAHWVGKENQWENFNQAITKTMDWNKLHEWKAAGLEIGSHTLTHPFLTQCDEEKIVHEIKMSKAILEEKLNDKVEFFCYPYGFFNQNIVDIVKKAGYKGAVAIYDHVPLWNQDFFSLPRIPIPARQSLWEFALKVGRFHIIFLVLRKLERNIKRMTKFKKQ